MPLQLNIPALKRIPAIVLCLFIFLKVDAQKSLVRKMQKGRVVDSVGIYLDSARYLSNRAPLRAIDNINRAIELSITRDDKTNEAKAFLVLGDIQRNLTQYDLASESYKKILILLSPKKTGKLFYMEDNQQTLFTAYKNLALSQNAMNKPDEAEYYIKRCLTNNFYSIPGSEQLQAKRILADIKVNQGKTKEALEILEEVLEKEKLEKNARGETETLLKMGAVHLKEEKDNKALDHFTKAKTVAEAGGFKDLAIEANDRMASIFRKQNNLTKEIELRNSNIAISNTDNNVQEVSKQNYQIGNAYLQTKQTQKAEEYFKSAGTKIITVDASSGSTAYNWSTEAPQKMFSKSEALEEAANSYKLLVEEYMRLNDLDKANEYFIKYNLLQDSMKSIRKKELEDAISLSTNIGKNQQRMELLEKERSLNEKSIDILKEDKVLKEEQLDFKNSVIIALVVCLAFMMLAGYFVNRSSREKRKVNQLLALKSLRGQMNPHFIFNALNSVNHYISQNDEREANRYLSDFSRLMRLVMDSSRHTFIPLSEELDMLKLYLQLEHSRFQEKFDYTYEVSDSLRDVDYELPPMLIQPYIENAVWHGLRYTDEKGKLQIRFEEGVNGLIVYISDNGIGRKRSLEIKTQNQKKQGSLGMQNIESRISIMNELFKTNIKVEISDAYPGQENCGTKVRLLIPQKSQAHA